MPTQSPEYKQRIEAKLDEAFKKQERSLTGFFIRNFRLTYLIIFFLLIAGVYSIFTLPREANPEVKIPIAVVTTVFPGATPTDTEDLITNKIEDKIKNLEHLRRYTSSSGGGISSIVVEFEADADLKDSINKLRTAVDEARPDLPSEAEDPVVTEISATDIPIVTYSIVGNYTESDLKTYADLLHDEFERVMNVSKVVTIGELEQEFQVIVDQTKLANYNLSLGQVVAAIARNNYSLPAGDIEIDGINYNVRVEGKFKEASALNDIVIATYNDAPVYIRDIALVKDAYKDRTTESKIGFKGVAARPTVSLEIYKRTGGNILDIVSESQAVIDRLYTDKSLPADLIIQKTNDNSVFIREDLSQLGMSGVETIILITLILLAVLSLRGAIITGLSVPFAFFMAFIFLMLEGMTLNSIVLFSLVLSLGLMVDNAIIIMEGVNEYITEHGRTPYQAAILAVWNYKWAITSGTMTTVAAFVPMLLVSGILGEYFAIIPKTISATLISSLFVAVVIIPTLVWRSLKLKTRADGTKHHRHKERHQLVDRYREKLKEKYTSFMRGIVPNKKIRRAAIITAWIAFLLAVAVPALGLMRIEMFPDVDVDYFVINLTLPVGSTLAETGAKTEAVERIISNIPELDNYVVNLGSSINLSNFDGSGSSGENKASITVNLAPKAERRRKSYEISESVRPQLKTIQGADVTLESISAGPPTGSPIEVRVTGDDTKVLTLLADRIKNYLGTVPGVINITDNIQNAPGDFTFRVDKQQANYYGLDIASVASTLRSALYGATASKVNINGKDVDITVKYNKDKFTNVNDLESLLITTPTGGNIPLKQVAELQLEPSLVAINHRNGDRSVIVSADIDRGVNLQAVLSQFADYQATLTLPEGANIQVGGEVEDIQQSYRETFESMIVAVILIAFILVLQFNSFRQPFIILFSLPLAIIGVIIGLNLFRLPFSFPAFIGIVSLAGISVNDAIVLIDRINNNIKDGMEYTESIIEAGAARMQPIFLTSLTTIAGIFPLVFASELWQGLSVAIIFGLIFSTVLTLFMVPLIYYGLCRKEKCGN